MAEASFGLTSEPTQTSFIQTSTTTVSTLPPPSTTWRVKYEAYVNKLWADAKPSQIAATCICLFIFEIACVLLTYFCTTVAVMYGFGLYLKSTVDALAWAGAMAIGIRFSVGHIDPIITILRLFYGKLGAYKWGVVFLFWTAQAVGCILASLFSWAFAPNNNRFFIAPNGPVQFGFTPGASFGMEIFLAFWFYLAIVIVFVSNRELNFTEVAARKKLDFWLPLVLGVARFLFVAISSSVSGGNLGWYFYFWDAAIAGTLSSSNWWVAFFSQPIGFILALSFFEFFHWVASIGFAPIHLDHFYTDMENFDKEK